MQSFTVIVYEAEEGGYWAEVPELPGCASQGETLDELKANVIEAIEACLQAHYEDVGPHRSKKVMRWDVEVADRGGLLV